VPRITTELKTRVVRWLDLLNKLEEVFLWNDDLVRDLVKESDNHEWMKLGRGC